LAFQRIIKTRAFFNFYGRKITAVTGTAVSPVTLAIKKHLFCETLSQLKQVLFFSMR
jgi:hypothetical protein